MTIPTPAGVFDAIAAGPPDGRPVLLLHGFPQSSLAWRRQLAALAAQGYRAVAPDQRGYSPAVRPQDAAQYAMDALVGDVLAIAGELGWPVFDLVGHDWGGAVAWWTADAHPDRLRTLAVVSTPHPGALAAALRSDADQRSRSQYMLDWREYPATERRMLADGGREMRALFGPGLPIEEMEAYLRRMSEPGALTAALNWYRAGRPGHHIGTIEVPTLYVWSTEDIAFGPAAAHLTRRWVTGPYRFQALEGITHWIPEEAAEPLNALLLQHLASGPDASGGKGRS